MGNFVSFLKNLEKEVGFGTQVNSLDTPELSPEILQRLLKDSGFSESTALVEIIFEAFDKDESGYMSANSFAACVLAICAGSFHEKLKASFDVYDFDRSGGIDKREMRLMLFTVSLMKYEETDELQDYIDVLVAETFQEYDLNKDGTLSFAEFENACKNDSDVASFYTEKIERKKASFRLRTSDRQ
jgi:Ca2+-binding EF-hand superfamily protein